MSIDCQQIYEQAKNWVLEAGEMIVSGFQESVQVEYKSSSSDLVTAMDRGIEAFFMNKISAAYPSHYILGEEGAGKDAVFQPEHEVVWVIDPIDGTTNFVHQQRSFSISVAVYDKGEGVVGFVYDPVHKELFHAIRGQGAYLNERKLPVMQPRRLEEALLSINPVWLVPNEKVDHHVLQPLVNRSRGIRCIGSAALETAYVACGRIDAYVDFRLSPWDIAAGLILLQETGAIAADPANGRIDPFHPSVTVFSKPGLHETILSSISNNVD